MASVAPVRYHLVQMTNLPIPQLDSLAVVGDPSSEQAAPVTADKGTEPPPLVVVVVVLAA